MQLLKKDILDMQSLSVEEIRIILDTAENLKEVS
jgi:aspartate carbamoyltransferase catalytic subunit